MDHLEPEQDAAAAPLFHQMVRRLFHPVAFCVLLAYAAVLFQAYWLLMNVVPDTVELHAFGFVREVPEIHRRLSERAMEIGFLLPGVFLLEYLWMGWQGSSIRHMLVDRTASVRSDLACYLLVLAPGWTLICAIVTFGAVYVSGEAVRRAIVHYTGVELSIAGLWLPLQALLLFGVYTFCDYWSHRLDHSKLFWPLHRFHHAAESFAVVTASRVHPAAFTTLVGVLPLALLGPSPWALLDVGVAVAVIRLLIHSRIESNFGWIGRWLVLSPLHHRLHHSLNRMPVNLGLIPAWDRLFGTFREAPRQAMPIGTPKSYRHGAWVAPDMVRDYWEFLTGALGYLKPGKARPQGKRKSSPAPIPTPEPADA